MEAYVGPRITPLGPSNYNRWKKDIRALLIDRGLWSVVSGTETLPREGVTPQLIADFKIKEDKSYSVIYLNVSETYKPIVDELSTGREAWEKLEQHFQPDSRALKAALTEEFLSCRLEDGEEMGLFLARLRALKDRLVEVGTPFTEWLTAYQAIRDLPDEYRSMVQVMYRWDDKQFTLDHVATELLAEESRLRHSNHEKLSAPENELALVARNAGKKHNPKKNLSTKDITCYRCGVRGHKSPQCRQKRNVNSRGKLQREQASFSGVESNLIYDSVGITDWIYDSAATAHFCRDRSQFKSFQPVKRQLMQVAAKGIKIPIKGKGTVHLDFGSMRVTLNDVLYSPRLRHNLISGNIIDSKGGEVIAKNGSLIIRLKEGNICCEKRNGLFICKAKPIDSVKKDKPLAQHVQILKDDRDLWHRRFCHIGLDAIVKSREREAIVGLPKLKAKNFECRVCKIAKSRSVSFKPIGKIRSRKVLELVHTDVAGPLPVPTILGHRYFVTFIDDYTRFVTVFPMKRKNEVFEIFRHYQARMERLTGKRILNVRSDNGAEYIHNEFQKYFGESGIKAERTNVYTPQQNGVSERFNLTAINAIRSMLIESNLKKELWGEALMCFEHTWNRVCRKDCEKTPYELIIERRPYVGNLKVFGSQCYVHIPKKLTNKFGPRARDGILVGYARKTKGYRVYLPDEDRVIETCNVKVVESAVNGGQNLEIFDFSFTPSKCDIVSLPSKSEEEPITESTPSTSDAPKKLAKPINWVKEVVTRKDKSRCDVYYRINGQGQRFRSHHDIEKYHRKHGLPYDRSRFDFRSRYSLHHPESEVESENEPDAAREEIEEGNITDASL